MTDAGTTDETGVRLELSAWTYRHLDRASKLLGVGLVALGLEMGGDTLTGVALGVVGAALALTTVFVRRQE
ncbi:hypothetical protein C499_06440 [Halogeometricum borinquense DSM 11551]|uniref:DUF8120 domain-containing protein n=1 Tax=Halogeometricum borinquense (strain ATCC 700274 / DSM 11551 / JCM 10706 / KCTC 4070 / PR3) TaxID=469382 RepID=E4NV34_HALBP|nr:hypothetical protein [Halogeometricum borinquense]ADQ69023.1 hypothetical protein Hbor_35030 [Halogeometricum borinquense DSM 11551]ELY29475.1 hypothetical protein C499_06440 [Halogeometricum borinquense DSM 11551]